MQGLVEWKMLLVLVVGALDWEGRRRRRAQLPAMFDLPPVAECVVRGFSRESLQFGLTASGAPCLSACLCLCAGLLMRGRLHAAHCWVVLHDE